MIDFSCPGCRRSYRVAETFAGRTARCKACGATMVVPQGDAPSQPVAPTMTVRTRRLLADLSAMRAAFGDANGLIRLLSAEGEPPDRYHLEYRVHSLVRGKKGKPEPGDVHQVEIQLTADYPRLGPQCRMLTPIFHPNIDSTTICIGDHWAAGERLVDLAARIGEMLAYQAYNIKSPLDAEAAMWADLNLARLPIDPRPMHGGTLTG